MGVSIWLDDLSRQRLVTGSLAGLVAHQHVVGVTTNADRLADPTVPLEEFPRRPTPRPDPAAVPWVRCGTASGRLENQDHHPERAGFLPQQRS